jgi:hypothetical protein
MTTFCFWKVVLTTISSGAARRRLQTEREQCHCEEAKPTKQSTGLALDRHAAARLAMTTLCFWQVVLTTISSGAVCRRLQTAQEHCHCEEAQPTKQSSGLALDRHAAARLAMTTFCFWQVHLMTISSGAARRRLQTQREHCARRRSRRSNPVNLALDRHAAARLAMTRRR